MKQNRSTLLLAILLFAMLMPSCAKAQKAKPSDKDLIGFWIMESMSYEGNKRNFISKDYGQVKVYRKNGEYACAQIIRVSDAETYIEPHEYGTYTMKNGKYTECGRKSTLIMTDKTHFEGPWLNRYDKWRKVTNVPAALEEYIVDKCRRKTDPKNIQDLTKKYILDAVK